MFSYDSPLKKVFFLIIILALLASAALLHNSLALQKQKLSPGAVISPEKSVKLALGFLGGFRSAMAAFLWMKMDRIHHDYYSNLYDEKELIPLYRIVAWLDPGFIYAYYVGSYVIYINNHPEEALSFAREGVTANPDSGALNLNAGQLYMLIRNDYPRARAYLEKALRVSKDDVEKYNTLVNLLVVYEKQNDLKNFKRIEDELRKYPVQPKFMESEEEKLEHEKE